MTSILDLKPCPRPYNLWVMLHKPLTYPPLKHDYWQLPYSHEKTSEHYCCTALLWFAFSWGTIIFLKVSLSHKPSSVSCSWWAVQRLPRSSLCGLGNLLMMRGSSFSVHNMMAQSMMMIYALFQFPPYSPLLIYNQLGFIFGRTSKFCHNKKCPQVKYR